MRERAISFNVGPSELFPTVAGYLETAIRDRVGSINHRSEEYKAIDRSTKDALRELLEIPREYQIFFVSSGTEAMERVIQNCVDIHSFHFVNGEFGDRFYQQAVALGKNAQKKSADPGFSFDLKQTVVLPHVELVCFTGNETSTGVWLPEKDIAQVKKANPKAFVAVDIVSAVPYVDLDYSSVDCAFFSVQKGFGLPSGLGVIVVSPQAIDKSAELKKSGLYTGGYHSFTELARYAERNQTPETPNVLGIYLLGKVSQDMIRIGIDRIRKDTETKAGIGYDFATGSVGFGPFVQNPFDRSMTTLVFKVDGGSKEMIERLNENGVEVSSGYGQFRDKHIRIGNFPAHRVEDMEGLVNHLRRL